MALRKPKASKAQARNRPLRGVATAVRELINENPVVRLVLEIAMRARALESLEPPRYIGIATDFVAVAPNSQYLVP
jgi:hypothetical protein